MNLAIAILLAAAAAEPAAEQRAREVLAQAREALRAKRAEPVRSLSLEAGLRRVQAMPGGETRDMSGGLTIDALFPDRYLKVETLSPMSHMPAFSIGTGLDGSQAWRAPLGGGGGPHMVIRVADGEGAAGAEALLRRTRAELLRLCLVALADVPEQGGLKLAHAGEAEAPEGRADIVEVSDDRGPIGRLFVDKASRRPLMLEFKTTAPRIQMRRMDVGEGGGPAGHDPAAAPAPLSQARLYVSDWKAVDGLLLPHRVSQSIENGPTEEWSVTKWKLDPALKPGHFKKP